MSKFERFNQWWGDFTGFGLAISLIVLAILVGATILIWREVFQLCLR
jgi:hypothetical protein